MSSSTDNKKNNNVWQSLLLWFDTYQFQLAKTTQLPNKSIDWARAIPFIGLHLACLLLFIVGWSPIAVIFAIAMYGIRMFSITAFYHRYFSHKAFKTGRKTQFAFALLGATAVQRGALWWAAHHRIHHATADKDTDQHSPKRHGLLWSHMG